MGIAEHLYRLLSYNVGGDKQMHSRWIGFRGELDAIGLLSGRDDVKRLLSGGVFLPTVQKSEALDNPVYFTIIGTSEILESYVPLYHAVSQIGCKALYLITYDDSVLFENWSSGDIMNCGVHLPMPKMSLYQYAGDDGFEICDQELSVLYNEYQKSRRSGPRTQIAFKDYPMNSLLDDFEGRALQTLYVERLIFDGLLGYGVYRGIPADIDSVILNGDGEMILVKIKEKDRSKRSPIGFGMDVKRRDSLMAMQRLTGLPLWYLVREVNNQSDREFVGWHGISIDRFAHKTQHAAIVEGGTGMRHARSSNPTVVCGIEHFQPL